MQKQFIPKRKDQQSAPLSFAQQRLWFLDQLEPNSPRYNVSRALKLRGELNLKVLQEAIDAIVSRHETLRSNFREVDGLPILITRPSMKTPMTFVDLSDQPIDCRENTLIATLNELVLRPYNLSTDAMLRASLVRVTRHDHVLLLVLPHITSDGWSMVILGQELMALYDSLLHGQPCPLPDLPIQYADYAVWQREWLQGDVLDRQLSYWGRTLAEISDLNLPTDRRRPAMPSCRNGAQSAKYPQHLADQLNDLARTERTTLFMTLLAAFDALLHRYTGQDDIAIGCPIANRQYVELEGLIGFFANTLVFRSSLSGNPTFRKLLARVREVALGAYEHQDVPFEKLVDELQPDRDLSRSPLFQVMFQLRNYPNQLVQLTELTIEPFELHSGIAKFDLSLAMTYEVDGLKAEIEYNPDLFECATITRMLGHFQTLLEGIVANPEQPIADVPLLTESERHQLLVEWNDTKTDYPQDMCIHQLFEAQVEKTSDAIALVFEDQQLTYHELNRRANQLAHYLRKLGVGPETLVALCLERSIETVVGLLAILKAGGAYVPMDPEYPSDRLDFMLRDTQAAVLLTQERLYRRLPVYPGQRVCFDQDRETVGRESGENLGQNTSAQNLAYVIYTSGSTGQPKGVAIEHRSTVAFLTWAHEIFSKDDLAGVLASTSICFDLSIFELFAPLTSGGRVILVENALALGQLDLAVAPTLINTVPSVMAELLRLKKFPPSIRTVNLAGEPLKASLVQAIYQHTSAWQVYDLYGPSETTTYSTYARRTVGGIQTIGRPIANTQVHILDSYLNAVPVGVSGELYIGGAGLAREYLNRPELTTEKFVRHPFSDKSGARLYRTGDLARYLPDGNIEYLGRIDNQVKIRGYRIELGEIEAVLGQHPSIRESVIFAREDIPGDRRLVAYVVAASGSVPSANELRSYLQQKLPEYMVPSAFMVLDSLPLTPNGKLDRKALPAPDQSRPELNETFTPPRTPVEEILASIWAEVLKLDKVGIHDNFFHLGGHSLLATQVISRLTKACQIELSLRSLFESPTVVGLAERVEHARRQQQGLPAFPILAVARKKELPASFAQQRLWFLDQYEPNSAVYNISSGLRLKGSLDVRALEQSLNEIVRRHETLRTTFSTHGGESVQLITPVLTVCVPIVELRNDPASEREKEAEKLAMEHGQELFDLSQGPLVRVLLLCLGQDDHVLVLTMHHIVSDGWSMGVIYRELSSLYQAYTRGQPSPLAELSFQYADFAIWQRQWLQGEVLERQLSYWKKQLDGAPAMLNLPTDRPRPPRQSHRGASQSIKLSQELMDVLRALSTRQGVTLFMTLLAAFQTLLHRYTGQRDIVVGSPIANRNHAEIEGLIGFFVNSLALRTDLSGDPTFNELLTRVRETTLGAYTHQDLPFEKLVEELRPERSLSHSPLFQVLFNMVEFGDNQCNISGLEAAEFSSTNLGSKYDLTIYVRIQPDGIQLKLVYNADLFDQPRMACVLQQYRYLLEQIVSAPEQQVRCYSLVTPESRLLLPDPSAVLSEASQELVSSTFLSCVNQSPDHPAVRQGDRSWTYRELADRAETLALTMVAKGLQQGDVVAIYGDRSFGMIAATIATLLSGGVLLPIDRSLPDRRKQLMLREAKAKKFLYVGAKQADDAWLEEEFNLDIIRVESQSGCTFTASVRSNPDSTQLPKLSTDDAAYIFFTSGTTGVPKGVLGCHKGLSHFLHWQRTTFGIGPDDRVAQLTSLSFDVVLRDIFLPLTSGATLLLPQDTLEVGSDQTVAWLARERISILHTVPAVAQAWFESLPQGASLAYMRGIFFAGEPLSAALVKRCREIVPKCCEIINLYGPTETTLAKCFYRVPADAGVGVLPVGQPIPNTQALVFADDHRLCGINEAGEIVLRTPFRSLGYINAPEEAQQRYVRNPFRDDPSDLIYFTGDAGRYRPDGTLEILGRLDDQVKIRGVRIELAEVTAILDRHPLVKSCIVVARTNERNETQLVAYAVLSAQDNFASNTLRTYLRAQLPAVMVPSNFVFLDKLPLTPNGKVDRNRLPMPESVPRTELAAPRTPAEDNIAEIWAEVLRVDRVGIHDNFFDLGGHSLRATQIVSRIRSAFSIELPLRTLFELPTVAEMAAMIEQNQAKRASDPELAQMLSEVEAMSDEEAQKIVAK